jgi:hypothetical protein
VALVIRIGPYQEWTEPDSLGRTWTGHFPRMTQQEAYQAGRGAWKLGPRALTERFALIVGGDRVRAVVEIEQFQDEPDERRSFTGKVLDDSHPVHKAYYGQPDPSGSMSRNPIAYADLPEEREFRTCACGCGEQTQRDFAPGHDQRAIHDRIRGHFGGSTLRFLEWFDANIDSGPERASA